jgi:hypothetical protein
MKAVEQIAQTRRKLALLETTVINDDEQSIGKKIRNHYDEIITKTFEQLKEWFLNLDKKARKTFIKAFNAFRKKANISENASLEKTRDWLIKGNDAAVSFFDKFFFYFSQTVYVVCGVALAVTAALKASSVLTGIILFGLVLGIAFAVARLFGRFLVYAFPKAGFEVVSSN